MKISKATKFFKGLAKGLRKTMEIGEKIIKPIGQIPGVRTYFDTLSGGLTERANTAYHRDKKNILRVLDVAEGKKKIGEALVGTKHENKYNNVIDKFHKVEAQAKPFINQARSTELGQNVMNKYNVENRYSQIRKVL